MTPRIRPVPSDHPAPSFVATRRIQGPDGGQARHAAWRHETLPVDASSSAPQGSAGQEFSRGRRGPIGSARFKTLLRRSPAVRATVLELRRRPGSPARPASAADRRMPPLAEAARARLDARSVPLSGGRELLIGRRM